MVPDLAFGLTAALVAAAGALAVHGLGSKERLSGFQKRLVAGLAAGVGLAAALSA